MTSFNPDSSPLELQPSHDPATPQQWDVLQTFDRPPSMELEVIRPLRTNPKTVFERFRHESPNNLSRIQEALPKFAQGSVGCSQKYGENLAVYSGYGKTYIGRISTDDQAFIKDASQCVYRNYKDPFHIDGTDVLGWAVLTSLPASIGGIIGLGIQNGQKIFDHVMSGDFFSRINYQLEGEIIGASVGAAPGVLFAGVVGVRAIAQSVNRARANTNMLVADLHDIASRAEQQFVELDNQSYTLHTGADTTVQIRAGTYVQDFLRDLSSEAVDYIWNSGLFAILRDVEAKQKQLEAVDEKMSTFKSDDLTAHAIAKGIRQEHSNELDEALHTLVRFRTNVLPEVVRISLEEGNSQVLK